MKCKRCRKRITDEEQSILTVQEARICVNCYVLDTRIRVLLRY